MAHTHQVVATLGGASPDGRGDAPGSFHLPADPRLVRASRPRVLAIGEGLREEVKAERLSWA